MKILFASTPWAGERHGAGPRQLNQVRSAGPCLCVPSTDSRKLQSQPQALAGGGQPGCLGARGRSLLASIAALHFSPAIQAFASASAQKGRPSGAHHRAPDLDSVGPVSLPDDLVGGVGCEAVRGSGAASLRQVQRTHRPPLSPSGTGNIAPETNAASLAGILEQIRAKRYRAAGERHRLHGHGYLWRGHRPLCLGDRDRANRTHRHQGHHDGHRVGEPDERHLQRGSDVGLHRHRQNDERREPAGRRERDRQRRPVRPASRPLRSPEPAPVQSPMPRSRRTPPPTRSPPPTPVTRTSPHRPSPPPRPVSRLTRLPPTPSGSPPLRSPTAWL